MDATKTIVCDVDGVVADILTPWLARYNLEWNDDLRTDEIIEYNTEKFVKPECGLGIYKYLDDPSLYDDVLPYDGAYDCIWRLKRIGYRVVWATSSPAKSYGRKFFWLKEYKFIHDQKDYFEARDKSLIRGDILIDDCPENLNVFTGRKILFGQTWNKSEMNNPDYHYANNYDDVLRYCYE